MSCCISINGIKAIIAGIVESHHGDNYKMFVARRASSKRLGLTLNIGVVVTPNDETNSNMFDDFIKLRDRADVCIKDIHSQVDLRDSKMIDLFIIEAEIGQ